MRSCNLTTLMCLVAAAAIVITTGGGARFPIGVEASRVAEGARPSGANVTKVGSIPIGIMDSQDYGSFTVTWKDLFYTRQGNEMVCVNVTSQTVRFRVQISGSLDFNVHGGYLLVSTEAQDKHVAVWNSHGAFLFTGRAIPVAVRSELSFVPNAETGDILYYIDESTTDACQVTLSGLQQGTTRVIRTSPQYGSQTFSKTDPTVVYVIDTASSNVTAVNLTQNATLWSFSWNSSPQTSLILPAYLGETATHFFMTVEGESVQQYLQVYQKGSTPTAVPTLVQTFPYGGNSVLYFRFLPVVNADGTRLTFFNASWMNSVGAIVVGDLNTGRILSVTNIFDASNGLSGATPVVMAPTRGGNFAPGTKQIVFWANTFYFAFEYPSGTVLIYRQLQGGVTEDENASALGSSGLVIANVLGASSELTTLTIRQGWSATTIWERSFSSSIALSQVSVFADLSMFAVTVNATVDLYHF